MRTRRITRIGMLLVVTIIAIGLDPRLTSGQESQTASSQSRMQIVIKRMMRQSPTFRGDKAGQIRLKWEWFDSVTGSYLFERRTLIEELSDGEKFLLRDEWVFSDTKVTFQDLLGLGPEHDDALIPILSQYSLLASAPASAFEGLMLYGKQGEVKGPVTKKYMAPTINGYAYMLEYKKANGELDVAGGIAYDAFNARWKDIKNRVAAETSQAKATEDRRILREAYEKAFIESTKAR